MIPTIANHSKATDKTLSGHLIATIVGKQGSLKTYKDYIIHCKTIAITAIGLVPKLLNERLE